MNPVFFCHYTPGLHQLIPLMEQLGGEMWTDDREVNRGMQRLAPHLPCRRFRPSSQRAVSRRAIQMQGDVFVGSNAHPYFFNRVPGPRVQTFHGVSSKGFAAQWRNTRYFDLLLLAGERMRRDFDRAGLLETTRWEVVGHIHGDKLTHGQIDVSGLRERHGFDANAPTVLYAPTWSGLSSFVGRGLEIVEAVPAAWNLIVKLHPWTIRRREAPAMVRAVRRAVGARPRAVVASADEDVCESMAAADLMIGDRSSVCEEYLLLDRPIVFFDHLSGAADLDAETRALLERGDWTDLHRCGPVARGGSELTLALEQSERDRDRDGEERRRMRDFVFHSPDGCAAQRAADAIRRVAAELSDHIVGERVFG